MKRGNHLVVNGGPKDFYLSKALKKNSSARGQGPQNNR